MKVCTYCEGSGYDVDGDEYLKPNWRDNVTDLGEIFATCPQCEGTGFLENSEHYINFRIDIDIRCSENAYFPQEVRDVVDRMNWGYDDAPRHGDYLLYLISTKFSEFREFGIFADRMAIGKYGSVSTITHLPSEVDERPSFLKDDQPTLFDEETCNCKCGCAVPLSSGTCVDCSDGTHQNQNGLSEYESEK